MRHQISILLAALTMAFVTDVQPQEIEVRLSETGIASWDFLSPKIPRAVGTNQSLAFRNDTGSRTFVVTIPFEFRPGEFDSSYAAASAARYSAQRSWFSPPPGVSTTTTLSTFVRAVYSDLSRDAALALDDLEYLRLLREHVKTLKADETQFENLATAGAGTVLNSGHVEALYWSAVCSASPDEQERIGAGTDDPPSVRAALEERTRQLVASLLRGNPVPDPLYPDGARCDAMALRSRILIRQYGTQATIAQPAGGPALTFGNRVTNTVLSRFTSSRTALVTAHLLKAIDDAIKLKYESEDPARPADAVSILEMLERERVEDVSSDPKVRNCQIRFLRTAATLIASYGPKGNVPFTSPALQEDPRTFCRSLTDDVSNMSDSEKLRYERAVTYTGAPGSVNDTGYEITDCTPDGKACTARATIPPYQRAVFTRSLLERRSGRVVQFSVMFFDETEPPANATGYAYLSARTAQSILSEPSPEAMPSSVAAKTLFNFGGDAGADYALPKGGVESHIRRTTGTGSFGFQYIGAFDLSATLQFKKGEFGGAAATNQVQASQYQAKVFGPRGTVFEYGKFLFAKPSAGIALNEFGEGLRFSWKWANLGYLIRRESDDPKQGGADLDDRDNYVLIGQVNAPVSHLRSLLLTATWGNEEAVRAPDKNPNCLLPDPADPTTADRPICIIPHTFSTFGFDAKFPMFKFSNVVVGAAAYHSVRNLRDDGRLDDGEGVTPHVSPDKNGRGNVALLTMSWSRLVEQGLRDPMAQAKPAFSLTGLLGYGSSDDPTTEDNDESYLGESAAYANDKLFLSTLAETKKVIGRGLANKWYAGIQYGNARWSPLYWGAVLFGATSEVQSMATTISLHKYRFIREIVPGIENGKNAGYEVDVDFLIETPKNVRWTLSGAWYRRSSAVEAIGIERNPWIINANISIKITP